MALVKKVLAWLLTLVLMLSAGYLYLHYRWKLLLSAALPLPLYPVEQKNRGDTMLVVMIGDSWAGMHQQQARDSSMQHRLSVGLGKPVKFVSSGKGGLKSKEVYYHMFRSATDSADIGAGFCTQELIELSPDYVVVMAGINDARANLGVEAYVKNMDMIIELLLEHDICPVIVEMPEVNLRRLCLGKPLYDKMGDGVRMLITGSSWYDVTAYSHRLKEHLAETGFLQKVLLVECSQWNPMGYKDSRHLYLDDEIHLNEYGYELLDSCITAVIAANG